MREKWKCIEGTNGWYSVSSEGDIRSNDRVVPARNGGSRKITGRILKVYSPKNGDYKSVMLGDFSKSSKRVHRLVAEAFIPNPKNQRCINHKNGNKQDNRVENLEWCSQKENLQHAHSTGLIKNLKKLSDDDVIEIRRLLMAQNGRGHKKIADAFNISVGHVSSIKRNITRINLNHQQTPL